MQKVERMTADQRLAICKSCAYLKGKYNRCALCNCFMNVKTKNPFARCPHNPPKWY